MSIKGLVSKFKSNDFESELRTRINLWTDIDKDFCLEIIEICKSYDPPFKFYEIIHEYDMININTDIGKICTCNLSTDSYYIPIIFLIEQFNLSFEKIISDMSVYLNTKPKYGNKSLKKIIDFMFKYEMCITNELLVVIGKRSLLYHCDYVKLFIDNGISLEQIIHCLYLKNNMNITINTIDIILESYDDIDEKNMTKLLNKTSVICPYSIRCINWMIQHDFDYSSRHIILSILSTNSIELFLKIYEKDEKNVNGGLKYLSGYNGLSVIIREYVDKNKLI